ncbi:hypothetical protein BraRD5C2_68970 [Bradyrhizobium sp. RD5-C2]|nr:hypothetical protein BraRD5C2_68970 [Bradyrhizobium sp. RD5-C2]
MPSNSYGFVDIVVLLNWSAWPGRHQPLGQMSGGLVVPRLSQQCFPLSTWGEFFSSLAQLSGFPGETFFKGENLNGPASSSLHDTYLVLRVLTVGCEFHES